MPKVTGEAVFGIDVVLPDMLIASVKQSPVIGGAVKFYDKAAALKVTGVKAVVPVDNGIAVVASNYWQAHKGLEALNVTFKGGATEGYTTASIDKSFSDALDDVNARTVLSNGDTGAAMQQTSHTHRMQYRAPYLAHSTMETMNATASVTDEFCEVWAPTQAQARAAQAAMQVTGLHPALNTGL